MMQKVENIFFDRCSKKNFFSLSNDNYFDTGRLEEVDI